jgi:predicted alpha/beta-hydrolase family hydrolase
MPAQRLTPTPHGDARLLVSRARKPTATLVLGHGAAGGPDARDLVALAEGLPREGISVIRVEQPWRIAGRRIAPAAPILDEVYAAAVARLRPSGALIVGGRSAGARVACRTAGQLQAHGCLALAFPLHPPGRPDRSRVAELNAAGVPTLVVQGERDALGRPAEFPEDVDMAVVPGADHGFAVLRSNALTQEETLTVLVEAVLEWVTREVA